MPYFGEPVGRVKIQTTSKLHNKTSNKRFIIQHTKLVCSCVNFLDIYLQAMRNKRMRSRMELAREIKPTDWSMAGNPSNRCSGVQIPHDICTHLKHYLYSAKCSWIINAYKAVIDFTKNKVILLSILKIMICFCALLARS